MKYAIKQLLGAAFCVTSLALATGAAAAPIPDLTGTETPQAAVALIMAAPPADLASQALLSLVNNSDDTVQLSPPTLSDASLMPVSSRHTVALLLAGVTLLAYRSRNQRLSLRVRG